MTKRLIRTSLIAGCLATALDEIFGGRAFEAFSMLRLRLIGDRPDITQADADGIFKDMRTSAIAGGMTDVQYDEVYKSVVAASDTVLETPGALEALYAEWNSMMATGTRKAARN